MQEHAPIKFASGKGMTEHPEGVTGIMGTQCVYIAWGSKQGTYHRLKQLIRWIFTGKAEFKL